MKKYILPICAGIALAFTANQTADAASHSHTVQKGDTLYQLGQQYSVTVESIKELNNKETSALQVGETLSLPAAITTEERELLSRLVHAEAQGEPYAGKVAVATVVLNRVDHPEFPDTIKEVINEIGPSGHYAFSPVQNGMINQQADDEAKQAVQEAIAFQSDSQGSIYFYNPEIATNHWIGTQTETVRIGKHVFAK
ncbi:cell wall hydrolase [Alkalihalophilus marmarensis]|jgi:N-acetylmuramoyl-L-alanine amidase|uniref:Peptidoglycan-binding protein n=1 Tax=Alkalihalophilus marmarensis DSM 21297 TaxID=1188261 RepID=U6SQL1_9BACI|nr:cell wall hydrolase [Alkalihalophilus marmarensis]ERN52926.1 peptidoglycan-binding protein [Alkalihalophilus marmarensis DSM 21297]MCM3489179.1 cell wall hydrolase [Alkalihalophilus marmarensis]